MRIDSIKPGEWFEQKNEQWKNDVAFWQQKQAELKDPAKNMAAAATSPVFAKSAPGSALAPIFAKSAPAVTTGALTPVEDKKKLDVAEKKAEEVVVMDIKSDEDEKKEEEQIDAKQNEESEKKEAEQTAEDETTNGHAKKEDAMDVDEPEKEDSDEKGPDHAAALKELHDFADKRDFDVYELDDVVVLDGVGNGEPLFAQFAYEDRTLMSLRAEVHLLVSAFAMDCKQPDHEGVSLDDLSFYYMRYFRKVFSAKTYAKENIADVLELIADTIVVDEESKIVESLLSADLESNGIFVKLTEESRRDRQSLIDSGDKSAELVFPPPPAQPATKAAPAVMSKSGGSLAPIQSKAGAPAMPLAWQQAQAAPLGQFLLKSPAVAPAWQGGGGKGCGAWGGAAAVVPAKGGWKGGGGGAGCWKGGGKTWGW